MKRVQLTSVKTQHVIHSRGAVWVYMLLLVLLNATVVNISSWESKIS